ncbi:MAG: carboxyltransferase domain-containing protein [Pseudomonadota bacterium]
MPESSHIRRIAEHLISIDAPNPFAANTLADYCRTIPGITESVAGMDGITLQFDPLATSAPVLIEQLRELNIRRFGSSAQSTTELTLNVQFGADAGPDLEQVARATGLQCEQIIDQLCHASLTVAMIGFTPGFAYCTGLPESLHTKRLSAPRPHSAAGSIALGPGYCGIYALAGPAGWPIVGRTEHVLFDADIDNPLMLRPGMSLGLQPQ